MHCTFCPPTIWATSLWDSVEIVQNRQRTKCTEHASKKIRPSKRLELYIFQRNDYQRAEIPENGGLDPWWLDVALFGAPRFSVQRSQNTYFKGFEELWTENRGAQKKRNPLDQPRRIQSPILGPLRLQTSFPARNLYL